MYIFFFSGFNFEKSSHFSRLPHSENSEKFSQYFSIMSNDLFVRDPSIQYDIYWTYDVMNTKLFDKLFIEFKMLYYSTKELRNVISFSGIRILRKE